MGNAELSTETAKSRFDSELASVNQHLQERQDEVRIAAREVLSRIVSIKALHLRTLIADVARMHCELNAAVATCALRLDAASSDLLGCIRNRRGFVLLLV